MHAPMPQAQIIPFPRAPRPQPLQVTIDGEFSDDEMPPELFPELFDADEDREELALYVHIADQWND